MARASQVFISLVFPISNYLQVLSGSPKIHIIKPLMMPQCLENLHALAQGPCEVTIQSYLSRLASSYFLVVPYT